MHIRYAHWKRWLTALLLAALAGCAHADFTGRVVGVLDGDTIDVLLDQQTVRVRLAQIDSPEKNQAFGQRAKQALSHLVFKRQVRVKEDGRDRYGRVLGTVYVDSSLPFVIDGPPLNVNAYLVSTGMAWAYRRYVSDAAMVELESRARREGRGLWAGPSPVAPWEWRANARDSQ